MKEINHLANFVQTHFKTDKINIASIGNMVPQLHVHVVGRFKTDPLWPESIWQAAYQAESYSEVDYAALVTEITQKMHTTLTL